LAKAIKLKNNVYLSTDSIGIDLWHGNTNQTITLNDNIYNYKYIEILWHDENWRDGGIKKVWIGRNKVEYPITLNTIRNDNTNLVIKNNEYTLKNNQLIVDSSRTVTISSNGAITTNTNNVIYLGNVIGYK